MAQDYLYTSKLSTFFRTYVPYVYVPYVYKDEYGPYALIQAIQRATLHNAYGAHYIENILYQERIPQTPHPPVRLKQEKLNRIRLEEPSLAEYDAFILKRRNPS
jgi:hypothetical protein